MTTIDTLSTVDQTMEGYRPAVAVELYDGQAIVSTRGPEGILDDFGMRGVLIDGCTIETIMESFGIRPAVLDHHTDKKGKLRQRTIIALMDDRPDGMYYSELRDAIVKLSGCSAPTAQRDIAKLTEQGEIIKTAEGKYYAKDLFTIK